MKNGYLMCSNLALSLIISQRNDFDEIFKVIGFSKDSINQKLLEFCELMKKENMGLHISNVTSRFSGEIKTLPGILIIDNNYHYTDINNLFTEVKKYINQQIPIEKVYIKFGYLPRFINEDCQFQISDAQRVVGHELILLDYFCTAVRTNEGLLKVLIHEMLHVLGFNETQVEDIQDSIYQKLKNDFTEDCQILKQTILERQEKFLDKMGNFYDINGFFGKDFRDKLPEIMFSDYEILADKVKFIELSDDFDGNKEEYFFL